jgi:hypothetical protein
MNTVQEAFYQNDFVRVMALVTKQLAVDLGGKVAPHQKAFEDAEATLSALRMAGHQEPVDLQQKTLESLLEFKAQMESVKTEAQSNLGLSDDLQSALGVDAEREQSKLDVANQWIFAIDQVLASQGGA